MLRARLETLGSLLTLAPAASAGGPIAELSQLRNYVQPNDRAGIETLDALFARAQFSPFNPTHVSSGTLNAWYRGDDSGMILVAGDVSSWPDKSGSGITAATQAVGANRPTFTASDANFGGQPSVDGSAAANLWLRATGMPNTTQPFTWFVVGTPPAANGNVVLDGLANDNSIVSKNGGNWAVFNGVQLNSTVAAGPNVAVLIIDGAASKLYVGKKTPDIGDAGALIVATAITMFNDGAHIFGGGVLAEVAVYAGALSQADVDALLDYGGARYNIAIGP